MATFAMIPQEWSVEVSRIKQYQFQANRGDTMELKATFWHKGEPFDLGGDTFRLYWQTNGMDSVYWSVPAVSASNTVSAVFANTMDPGAPIVYGFLGATSGNYRASFAIRYAPGPGAVPNALPLPAKSIDFAQVEVFNAPWLLPGATNDIGTIKVELGSLSNSVSTLSATAATNSAAIATLKDTTATLSNTTATINSKIPSAASASNQLADKEWIDAEIDTYAAYYITYTAAGAAFPTREALLNATVVYSGGAARTPTRNDYAVVLADESHGGAEWRYIYTVAAGATSGQWDAQYPIETNDYDGLSNKPQINGVSLSGNKTGADLSLQDALTTQQLANIEAVPNKANNSDVVHTTGDETIGGDKTFTGANTVIPFISAGYGSIQIGISGRISQETAGGLLGDIYVPNYGEVKSAIAAAISPTDTTFSNAVLSVGLGIDTNTVAVINELVDSAHDLPVTGATSVGALLLALAAAVAALKKKFGYDTPTAITASAQLADRTNNNVAPTSGSAAIALTFPDAVAGKGRDFLVLVSPGANYSGTISFTTPANATIYGDGFGATIAAGESWLFSVTEIASNVFYTRAQKMEVPS